MAKEICISSTPHETRLAILEDDQLAEIYYERENEYTLAGSVYNGRVTRVLPGMQSAFVDIGLERDAFLYVTDFLELEDQEETDELERAATAGGNQPPREVRHAGSQEQIAQAAQPARGSGGRQDDRAARSGQRPAQKQEARPEPRPDRAPKDTRFAVEAVPGSEEDTFADSSATVFSGQAEGSKKDADSGAPGARRWRGRRRRRGGPGQSGAPERDAETESSAATSPEGPPETVMAQTIQASAARFPASAPVAGHTPVPFVLPGESLSKYGGTPAPEAPQFSSAPAQPGSTFKPATLIEAPLAWDGSGLLPGESISRHRSPQTQPGRQEEPLASDAAPELIEEGEFAEDFFEEHSVRVTESDPEPGLQAAPESAGDDSVEEEFIEEEEFFPVIPSEETGASAQQPHTAKATLPQAASAIPVDHEVKPAIDELLAAESAPSAPASTEPASHEPFIPEAAAPKPAQHESAQTESHEGDSPEPESEEPTSGASASHRVDPNPPTGFRLFGLGKKKTEEHAPAPPAAKPTSVAAVSAFAPGSGHIEEEIIEGDEFDAPRPAHHGKAEEHDLDDFEEETLPTQMRSGDLGELLQEAHLDHRIQMNFDSQNGDEDEDGEGDEEETSAEGLPAAEAPSHPRRDRGGREHRGRGAAGVQASRRGPSRRSAQTSDLPIISDLLKPGQEILVQIAKEPIAKKGARITSHIALPGRFLVFMPTVSHVGVSRKIASDEERQRLKRILTHERGDASGGFIVRTAAEGASEEELRSDLRFLMNLWAEIKQRSDSSKSPALIYHDLSLIERILRDQVSSNFSNIWVDSEADYERIVRFLNRFSPTLVRRVKLYTKELPLFEHFGIQDEISKALRSKVWLKSGGSIVINQTEALVAIDINTGKYVGKSARLEDTILKTNLDAVPEIVHQIRLRDLGGIIVIDFIDMDERKNRFKVMAALEEALKSDRAPTKVLQFNDFGLVAITRKRVKQSLERTLSVPCPICQATGMVKSPTTVCNEIYTELRKMRKHFEGADVLLRVNPETVKVLKSNNASWLVEFEELTGKNILVKSDPTLHPEQFDIQG
jgi:ribonuclease G